MITHLDAGRPVTLPAAPQPPKAAATVQVDGPIPELIAGGLS